MNEDGSGKACSYPCELGWKPNSTKTACEEVYVCLAYKIVNGYYDASLPDIIPATEEDCKAYKVKGSRQLKHRWSYSDAKSEMDKRANIGNNVVILFLDLMIFVYMMM